MPTNYEDVLDVQDIINRVESLREDHGDHTPESRYCPGHSEHDEFEALVALLGELKGNGGDYEWHGDWYPLTLIRDSYFTTHAQELAEDIGALSQNLQWPLNHIDWEMAANELQSDYMSVEFGGVRYWTR